VEKPDISDLQGHTTLANLFERDFLYSCAAVDKILTDKACCEVPQ